jgi:SAM-dependent methyltransferase
MTEGPLRGHQAPLDYHRRLLDDPHRLDAFERALRALVRPGDLVLDAGAGTGILGMLAARLGAARVHAVESMPIARVARELVRHNRLDDRVIVHEADLVTLAPIEPVDVVVGDFLGAFLVDDRMLDAVAAAARWLRPGGAFIPSRVRLYLAPAGGFGFPPIDVAGGSIHGVSLRALEPHVLNANYRADLGPDLLLAPPALYADWRPDAPCDFDAGVGFTLERAGRLRGLAGWFEAELAPGVTLSTAPGIETHWGQVLFPLPTAEVAAGERLEARLRFRDDEWEWQARGVTLETRERFGARPEVPPLPPAEGDPLDASDRGAAAREAGRTAEALACWEEAVRLLDPRDPAAPAVYENLAVGCLDAGRPGDAARALLRALDGDAGSREPSLRYLVYAFHDAGRPADAARALAEYQRRYGRHPLTPRANPP